MEISNDLFALDIRKNSWYQISELKDTLLCIYFMYWLICNLYVLITPTDEYKSIITWNRNIIMSSYNTDIKKKEKDF